MTGWSVDPVGGPWLWAAAAAALLPLLALGPNRQQSRGRRITLTLLRGLTLLMLLIALLRPALESTETKALPGTLIVLGDASRSMQVEDSLANASRYEALKSVLAEAKTPLAELAATWDLRPYTFSEELKPAAIEEGDIALPEAPEGNQTAIGAALEDVLDREAQQRIVAVLLLSDGSQRAFAPRDAPPQTVARRLAVDGIPLYTFVFGQPALGDRADVRLSDMLTSDTVFAETPTTVSGMVSASGYANQPFNLQLLWENAEGEMEVVDARRVELKGRTRQSTVRLDYTPREPGEYKVTLRVESPEGELITANNEQSTFVTVLKGGVNVLYLAGSARIGGGPGIEPRFIRSALSAHPDLNIDYELINYRNPEADYRRRLEEGKYDVFLLGNVDVEAFDQPTWQEIADLVEEGAGLGMLGGFHSFGPGGFYDSPLARVLPVRMSRLENQKFGEKPSGDLHLPAGPVQFVPVRRNGQLHPLLRIGEENDDPWAKLPPLDGANKFDRLRLAPNASVVAETATQPPSPLLVLGGWGEGRTAALAVDSTWHWTMEGHGDLMRRFWRQFVLWLAKKDEISGRQVWARLDGRRYQQGNRVDFEVGARDDQGQPLPSATFDVQVELPDGKIESVRTTRRGDKHTASFIETSQAGDYRIIVRARVDDASLGMTNLRFAVTDQDVELDQPAADPTLLAALANATEAAGGEALAPEEFPALLERLKEKQADFEETIVRQFTLWDTWPMLLGFVSLLGTEWFLRKKWGMV